MVIQKQQNKTKAYKNTEISTANQKKLILMLYDGALRFMRIAIDNMQPRSYDVVNNNIVKAQDILTELMLALDTNGGNEIAANLFNIYAYAKKRLLEANIAKETANIEEVLHLLTQLRDAWEQAAENEEQQNASDAAMMAKEGTSISMHG